MISRRKAGVVWDRNKIVLGYIAVLVTISTAILIYQLVWA